MEFYMIHFKSLLTIALFLFVTAPPGAVMAQTVSNEILHSWVELENYGGDLDSPPISRTDYHQLVFELQQCRQASASKERGTLHSLQTVDPMVYEQISTPRNNARHRVALSLLHWDRAVVDETASSQAIEKSAVAETAETNITVFAFSPIKTTTYRGGDLEVVFDSADFFEVINSPSSQIANLYLDSGDGQGQQPIDLNVPVFVSYDSTGEKTLSLVAVTTDGTTLYAEATLQVAALATPNPTQTIRVQADSPYAEFGGSLYVYKSPGTHIGLRHPVLVVEGFDMNNDMDWDVLYNILNKETLVESLFAFGRDMIVLDFDDATADIFGNAWLAMNAIDYINANRVSLSGKFTVIGASMGGLVTRNALAMMDAYPSSYGHHHVDTWISFDSPQTGANLPLGVQEYFNFFGGFSSKYPELAIAKEYQQKLDSPAAKEMLLCHYTCTSSQAGPSPSYNWFWGSMNAYGYPTSCKKIAISNGSGYGYKQYFTPGQQIIQWHQDDGFTLEIGSKIYALYKSSSVASTDFYGRFDPWDWFDQIDATVYERSYYPYGLDNASGGTRSTFKELFEKLPYRNSDDWCSYNDHCFIPTCSSLGIPISKIEQTIHNNSTVLNLSPFDEVHYAFSNEAHIEINARNKPWFIRAILEGFDTDTDGFDDYEEYLLGTAYNDASDKLKFSIESIATSNLTTLKWPANPNTQYYIYKTDALVESTWNLVGSIRSSSTNFISQAFANTDYSTNAFFKITAQPSDPVQD